jgi:hypothetical protein
VDDELHARIVDAAGHLDGGVARRVVDHDDPVDETRDAL